MGEATLVEQRFCTTCGAALGDCDCTNRHSESRAPLIGGRGRWPLAIVLASSLVLGMTAVAISIIDRSSSGSEIAALNTALNRSKLSVSELRGQVAVNQAGTAALGSRVAALQADADKQRSASPATIAARVKPSVFTVVTDQGLGSGFVVSSSSSSATLLTNFHVIADVWVNGGRDVKIQQHDSTFDGRIRRVSEADDLALITVNQHLPTLAFSRTRPTVGDSVMAFGSPLGLEGTVSSGIVSALRHENGQSYLQFTAAISPGNSGGPVVASDGRVLGVAEMKMVGDNAENLAFAIPAATVCADFSVC